MQYSQVVDQSGQGCVCVCVCVHALIQSCVLQVQFYLNKRTKETKVNAPSHPPLPRPPPNSVVGEYKSAP